MGLSRLRKFFAAGIILISHQVVNAQNISQDDRIAQRIVDSLAVEEHYDQGLGLFMDFCYYLHPFQIDNNQSFAEEIAIADAPEAIRNDLFFTPDSSILTLHDLDVSYNNIPQVDDQIISDRLTCLNSGIPLVLNEQVRGYIDYFTVRRRDYTLRMLSRKNLYFHMFEQQLAEHHLPDELKYLSIVESALIPTAVSPAGAVGLWQFMPRTGQSFGLKLDSYIDERKDPEKSTVAACKYLQSLYNYYNDWELALAAYNCGPGTINRAMRRSGKSNFWGIYNHLPRETRAYVPMFVAVVYAMNYAEDHNIIQNQPYYPIEAEVVEVSQYVSLKELAQKLNVCVADLEELNPELRKKVVPSYAKNYRLRIPAERRELWENQQQYMLSPLKKQESEQITASVDKETRPATMIRSSNTAAKVKTLHTIKRGESLNLIARKYGVSIAELKTWNKLRNTMIHTGDKLVIWKKGTQQKEMQVITASARETTVKTDAAEEKAEIKKEEVKTETVKKETTSKAAVVKTKSTQKTVVKTAKVHVVKRGDSLWSIANKNGMTVAELKKLNGLRSDKLSLNQKLKLN